MRRKNTVCFKIVILLSILAFLNDPLVSRDQKFDFSVEETGKKIEDLMEDADIPGLALVIVNGDGETFIKGFGYADLERREPVTSRTLFELASCSKAFTALAVLKLEQQGLIDLDAPVSKYLPWFRAQYEGRNYDITLRQLLHHTGGIPWKSIDLIPEGEDPEALEETIKKLAGIELNHIPGTKFEYATVNYDILGLIIEKKGGMPYEEYMRKHIFLPLGLASTSVGKEKDNPLMATGYKIGFFQPREYDAPPYRGNNPAGYIVSNADDMARWLKWQMGLMEPEGDFHRLIRRTQVRDESVPPNPATFSSYCMGWQAYVNGSDIIDHGGDNPNFTAYVGFSPKDNVGVVVLANSSSTNTHALGRFLLDSARGKEVKVPSSKGSGLDKASSVASAILLLYLLCITLFLLSIPVDLVRGRRRFEGFTLGKGIKLLATLLMLLPFLLAVYFIPGALADVSWEVTVVWSPVSFLAAAILLLAAMGMSYLGYFVSSFFPQKSQYMKSLPLIIVLSLLAGGANAMVIFLISSSLFSDITLAYQLYFFALAFFVSILGRKVLETRLIKLTYNIVYDLRMRLINKVFLTSYQRFERLDRGRIYATLNDDTGQIGNFANIIVQLITSVITTIGAFVYLATIAFWATAITLAVVVAIAVLYGVVSQKAEVFFEKARDTRNVFMGLINGLLDGFKELSLHINKKKEYSDDLEKSCDEFRNKITIAMVKFINAFLIGESFLIIVLGAVSFGIPRIFPDIGTFTLMSFIMILLYLIGPINGILNSIPSLVQIRVAWNRVKGFEKDIPANIEAESLEAFRKETQDVEKIEARGVVFEYESEDGDEEGFKVGPLDFEASKGEITFIIGGNGSGKTTLAKLLTGLYTPQQGEIRVNGQEVVSGNGRLGEYFSTVFSDYHLFSKLYDVDLRGKEDEIRQNLEILRLDDKVEVKDRSFTTIDLSGGQRKRLALMQCYLENSPIYLFDEIAADQDPEFRKFFYRDLLLRMKEEGKIVIAITHDDHYFDVADRIIKMDMGKVEFLKKAEPV